MPSFPVPRLRAVAAALAAMLTLALLSAAVAQALTHPRLLAPKQGKVLHRGGRPTFKVHDGTTQARKHHVWITISAKRKVKHGELQIPGAHTSGTFSHMKRRKHGKWTYRPPNYSFPSWFMQRRGTYYWQAFHIDCGPAAPKTCHVHSKIHKFKVR